MPLWGRQEFCAALQVPTMKRSVLCDIFASCKCCVHMCVCVYTMYIDMESAIFFLYFICKTLLFWFPKFACILRKMNPSYCNKIFFWLLTNGTRKQFSQVYCWGKIVHLKIWELDYTTSIANGKVWLLLNLLPLLSPLN